MVHLRSVVEEPASYSSHRHLRLEVVGVGRPDKRTTTAAAGVAGPGRSLRMHRSFSSPSPAMSFYLMILRCEEMRRAEGKQRKLEMAAQNSDAL